MAGNKHTRRKAEIVLPSGEELFWQIIRKLNAEGTWSIPDVAVFAGSRPSVVQNYVYRLETGGFVRRTGGSKKGRKGECVEYELLIDRPIAPRLNKKGIEHPEMLIDVLWRTMRMLKRFTTQDLAGHVAELDRPVKVPCIRSYVTALVAAGVVVHDGEVGWGEWQPYRLAKALGPQAPRILAARVVFDPNGNATVGAAETREVAL